MQCTVCVSVVVLEYTAEDRIADLQWSAMPITMHCISVACTCRLPAPTYTCIYIIHYRTSKGDSSPKIRSLARTLIRCRVAHIAY